MTSSTDDGVSRRRFLGMSAATVAAAAAANSLSGCTRMTRPSLDGGPGLGHFGRFGVTAELVRTALTEALSRGGGFAELFFQHRVSNALALEEGEIGLDTTRVELGVGVRVIDRGKVGYAYTEELDPESVRLAAQSAAAVATGTPRAAVTRLRVGPALPQRYAVEVGWDRVGVEQKRPILTGLDAALRRADPRIKRVRAFLGDEAAAILIADSQGRLIEDYQPLTGLSVELVAEHRGRRESNGYSCSGRAGFEFYTPERLERVRRRALERTLVLFEAGTPPVGELPVVFAAGSSGILLHEAIGHGMEADFNRRGASRYANRINRTVARPFVNIVDDGTLEATSGALNVDDEGNAVERTLLVDHGVLATYMHDAASAEHFGARLTGNGRRQSYAYPPMPRMRTTYLLPGPHGREEILGSVKRGIFCESFTEGRVRLGAGDFSFEVKNAWLIEDGRLTRPLKDLRLIGDGPSLLEAVDMVADDLVIDEATGYCGKDGQRVPVSLGTPTVRVASVTVAGTGRGGG